MDFRTSIAIGTHINDKYEQLQLAGGYDHNWVLRDYTKKVRKAAEVYEPASGRVLTLLTDQPGLQFYTGNFLDGKAKGKNGVAYQLRTGFCLEAQFIRTRPISRISLRQFCVREKCTIKPRSINFRQNNCEVFNMGSSLQTLDWLAIGAYFAVLLSVAWWVVRKGKDEAADYFLAGRNLSWWIIGASIFASNIGSEHIVGLAGSGAKDGVALAHYEFHAWCLLVLAWVFVPFYARSLVFTMPEFLERRFSVHSRYVLSVVSIVTFIVAKIAVGIFAGGVVFATLLPEMQLTIAGHVVDAFWIGSVIVIVLTGLYTAIGGMRAVAYNDAVEQQCLLFRGQPPVPGVPVADGEGQPAHGVILYPFPVPDGHVEHPPEERQFLIDRCRLHLLRPQPPVIRHNPLLIS